MYSIKKSKQQNTKQEIKKENIEMGRERRVKLMENIGNMPS